MEYDWAANVLPLPCDQRYGAERNTISPYSREWEKQVMKHTIADTGNTGRICTAGAEGREGYYTIVCDGYPDIRQENLQMRHFRSR